MLDDEFLLEVCFRKRKTVESKEHLQSYERLKNSDYISGTQIKGIGRGYFENLHVTRDGVLWLQSLGKLGSNVDEIDGMIDSLGMAYKGYLSEVPFHHLYFMDEVDWIDLSDDGQGGLRVTIKNEGFRNLPREDR